MNIISGNLGYKGANAYEIAVENGYDGTLEEWLDSLDLAISDNISSSSTNTTASGSKAVYDYIEYKKSTTISDSSTNDNIATPKAVFDYIESKISDNISSSSTNTTASGSKAVYDYIESMKSQIITLNISDSEQQLITNTNYTFLNLNNIENSTTNSTFTKQSYTPSGYERTIQGVGIPAGISKVKVSSNVQFNNKSSSPMYFINSIYKCKTNGDIELIARSITNSITEDISESATCSPIIVDVEEGDTIGVRTYKSLATSSSLATVGGESKTYLTVEKVE